MKKKLLFVLSTLKTGGVTSSLDCLFSHIKETYDVSIMPLSYDSECTIGFGKNLLKRNLLLDAYMCDFSKSKGLIRIYVLLVKTIKKIVNSLGGDSESIVFKRVAKKIGRKQYDIVIAYQEGETTRFCSFLKCNRKIAWIHSDYCRAYPNNNDVDLYSVYSYIVCVSQFTANRFVDRYPQLKDNVVVFHNLLDSKRIVNLASEAIDDNRFELKDFTIISIGRIIPLKRFKEIPRIARLLIDDGVKFQWCILGPVSDSVEYKALINNIIEYGVEDCVHYLGNKPNPYPYLKASNLLVSLSTSEACPMIFNEAYTFGKPIVSSDFGSAWEFIKQDVNGVVMPIEAIPNVLERIILDRDYYGRLTEGASYTVINNEQIISSIKETLFN